VKAKSAISRAGLALLLVVAFLGSCGALQFALHKKFNQRKPVAGAVPPEFPVVVVTPEEKDGKLHARIIYQKNLLEFMEKNPGYSFRVPPGEAERLRDALWKASVVGGAEVDTPWKASFTVEPRPNGRQAFEVEYDPYDDLSTKSWYEATDKEIFPQYHYQYAEVGGMFTAGAAIFLNVVLWAAALVIFLAYKFYARWRKKKAAPTAP